MTDPSPISDYARQMAARVEAFVRDIIVPYEQDPRRDHHGAPTDELVYEMRGLAREAGVLTPHIRPDGSHLNQISEAEASEPTCSQSSPTTVPFSSRTVPPSTPPM